jgi:ABC-type dipeptide/oligopeptide/nickel transport system permease component
MAVAGSLVVEVICNIPGMGRLMFESIFIRDWPVVMGVVMITGMLTSLGMLLSDLWYMWVDPRVHV